MPVSKNRKNHKVKINERFITKQKEKEAMEKQIKDFIAKAKEAKNKEPTEDE